MLRQKVRSFKIYLRKSSLSQPGKVKRVDDDKVDLDLLLAEPVDALACEPARVGLLHVADLQRLLGRPVTSHLVVNLVAEYCNLLWYSGKVLTICSPFDHSMIGAGFPSIGHTNFTWA